MSKRTATHLALVIAALVALLAALPAFAQPLRTEASTPHRSADPFWEGEGESVRLVFSEADTPTAYRTVMVTLMGGSGAVVGGGMALVGVGMVDLLTSEASFFSSGREEDEANLVFYGLAAAAGSTLGTSLVIAMIGGEPRYGGILPDPDIRSGDGRPALLGALVALPVGIASALLIQQVVPEGADPFMYLAVPVLQGVGAAIAINLSR